MGGPLSLSLYQEPKMSQMADLSKILIYPQKRTVVSFGEGYPAPISFINTAMYAYFSPEFRKNCFKFGCCSVSSSAFHSIAGSQCGCVNRLVRSNKTYETCQ